MEYQEICVTAASVQKHNKKYFELCFKQHVL